MPYSLKTSPKEGSSDRVLSAVGGASCRAQWRDAGKAVARGRRLCSAHSLSRFQSQFHLRRVREFGKPGVCV